MHPFTFSTSIINLARFTQVFGKKHFNDLVEGWITYNTHMGVKYNHCLFHPVLVGRQKINFIFLRRSAQRAHTELNICAVSIFVATKVIDSRSESCNYVSICFRSMPGQVSFIS